MSTLSNRIKIYVRYRVKCCLASMIRFVVSRPRLLSLGMRVLNRMPALKWWLWRIHASARGGVQGWQSSGLSGDVPASALPIYLQLTDRAES